MRKVRVSHLHFICLRYSKSRESVRSVISVREEHCMRILVAEDHPSLGPDLKKGLERCHYAVDLVANGEDALSLGFEVPYDLIILAGVHATACTCASRRRIPVPFTRN